MKKIFLIHILIVSIYSSITTAADYGSPEYCAQLANIGMNTYNAKREGHSFSAISSIVSNGLSHDQDKQRLALGVVAAIYGDSTISSSSEAYNLVFDSCFK